MGQNSQNIQCHCEPVTDVTGVAIRSPCLPLGEGGSRVPRKRETDEGNLPLTLRKVPGRSGESVFTLSVGFAASSPRVGAKGERGVRIATPALRRWLAMTYVIRWPRNDRGIATPALRRWFAMTYVIRWPPE